MVLPRLVPPWSDAIDILVVTVLLYAVIVGLRGARAYLALLGIGILGGIYLLAGALGLALAQTILQAVFAAAILLLVVIFQGELRQGFERLAMWSLPQTHDESQSAGLVEKLVRAVVDLIARRHGALLVLCGRDPLERHTSGGVALDALLSEPLLLSLFDPHSPGHDGAVILCRNRLQRFAVRLPLSSDDDQLRQRGTRHAAALGLAERTDALCIAVSEERGTVSIASQGRLVELERASELASHVRAFLDRESGGTTEVAAPIRLFRQRWREMGLALGISLLLWVLVIPGSQASHRVLEVAVAVENLPEGYTLESVTPPSVAATVSGLRRDLFLLDARDITVHVDGFLVDMGRRTFELSPDAVRLPSGLTIDALEPSRVRITVRRDAGAPAPSSR